MTAGDEKCNLRRKSANETERDDTERKGIEAPKTVANGQELEEYDAREWL